MSAENGNGHTNGKLVLCPGSHEAFSTVLLDQENLHRVPQSELDAHRGLCAKCFARIQKGHAHIRRGETEMPVDFESLKRQAHNPEVDHLGYDGPGMVVQVLDFDYQGVDELLGFLDSSSADARVEAAVVLSRISEWTWQHRGNVRSALVRFSTLMCGLRPDLLNDMTLKELGLALGITKQGASKAMLHAAHEFGIRFARARQDSARENMRRAQLGHKATNVKRANHTPPL